MPAWTNATSTTAGILRPEEFARHATVERRPPSPSLTRWVEYHWHLRWGLPSGARYVSRTLPHPACTLSVELGHPRAGVGDDRVVLTGVVTRRFDVELADRGWVWGVKFRPGGLAALTGLDVGALTDRTVPATELLGDGVVAPLRGLVGPPEAAPGPDVAQAVVEDALAGLPPDAARERDHDTVLALVATMLGDRSVLRVGDLEERHALSTRQVQRLFARSVGVGPKWVLARYRMHDLLEVLDAGTDEPLADLAAAHGWYDQAHFTRDFTALVGVSPGEYRAGRIDRKGVS